MLARLKINIDAFNRTIDSQWQMRSNGNSWTTENQNLFGLLSNLREFSALLGSQKLFLRESKSTCQFPDPNLPGRNSEACIPFAVAFCLFGFLKMESEKKHSLKEKTYSAPNVYFRVLWECPKRLFQIGDRERNAEMENHSSDNTNKAKTQISEGPISRQGFEH